MKLGVSAYSYFGALSDNFTVADAIKHAKKVEKGMYLQYAKQAIWISIVAMIMSVVMMVIRLILAPDMLYNALQGIYKFISALISPERPY